MVTMFFFYSGFGCWESFCTKKDYVKGFLRRRVLKTLVHFDIAVALYVVVDFALKLQYPLKNYVLCWIGWESLGNSSWFIFTILLLYMATWIGFKFFGHNKCKCLVTITSLCILLMAALYVAGKETWWYNTALCYPLGMIYSCTRHRIEKVLTKPYLYWSGLAAIFIIFLILYMRGGARLYPLCACAFSTIVIFVTAKLDFGNPILIWFGNHLFEIYILQRIPMIVLSSLAIKGPMTFMILTIVFTIAMAGAFSKALKRLDDIFIR